MKNLLLRIAKKAMATKLIDSQDIARLLVYNAKHPMWRVTADPKTVAAYDAIMKQITIAA